MKNFPVNRFAYSIHKILNNQNRWDSKMVMDIVGEDTRLRILAILSISKREIAVKEICSILKISQPAISKHLTRLRLLRIVKDKRCGNIIRYSLNCDSEQGKVRSLILPEFNMIEVFCKDVKRLKLLIRKK